MAPRRAARVARATTHRPLRARHAEAHARPDARVLEPDAAAVGLDDRSRDGEAETGRAVASRRALGALHERIEDACAVGGRDALAGVRDLDLDHAVARLGAHHDAAVGRRVAYRV